MPQIKMDVFNWNVSLVSELGWHLSKQTYCFWDQHLTSTCAINVWWKVYALQDSIKSEVDSDQVLNNQETQHKATPRFQALTTWKTSEK